MKCRGARASLACMVCVCMVLGPSLLASCSDVNSYTDYSEQYVARSLERLDHPSEYPNSHMGRSISVHQNRALAGCPTIGADVGAFVYELGAGGIWKHVATLKPSDLDSRDEAGTTVAIHGDLEETAGAVFDFRK